MVTSGGFSSTNGDWGINQHKNAKVQNGMRAYLDNAGGAMGFIGKYALDELNISINFDQFYIQND